MPHSRITDIHLVIPESGMFQALFDKSLKISIIHPHSNNSRVDGNIFRNPVGIGAVKQYTRFQFRTFFPGFIQNLFVKSEKAFGIISRISRIIHRKTIFTFTAVSRAVINTETCTVTRIFFFVSDQIINTQRLKIPVADTGLPAGVWIGIINKTLPFDERIIFRMGLAVFFRRNDRSE